MPFGRTWRGAGVHSCTDVVGNTRNCRDSYGQPLVLNVPVALSLLHTGGVLTGTIQVGGSGGRTLLTGPVFAGVDHIGRLVSGG